LENPSADILPLIDRQLYRSSYIDYTYGGPHTNASGNEAKFYIELQTGSKKKVGED
jgi:hypothetical protein